MGRSTIRSRCRAAARTLLWIGFVAVLAIAASAHLRLNFQKQAAWSRHLENFQNQSLREARILSLLQSGAKRSILERELNHRRPFETLKDDGVMQGVVFNDPETGQYLFLFGCDAFNSAAGNQLTLSIQVNATAASDSDATLADAPSATYKVCLMRAVTKTLASGGNNTITCKYRVSAGTGSFENRWLIALRFAN